MEALKRAGLYVQQLESRVRELEQLCLEKDAVLRRLVSEIPMGDRKAARLLAGIDLASPSSASSSPAVPPKWPAHLVRPLLLLRPPKEISGMAAFSSAFFVFCAFEHCSCFGRNRLSLPFSIHPSCTL